MEDTDFAADTSTSSDGASSPALMTNDGFKLPPPPPGAGRSKVNEPSSPAKRCKGMN